MTPVRRALACTFAALLVMLLGGAGPAGAQPAQHVEINQATEAQLDGVRGLGPATTRRILTERGRKPFADWQDLIARVKGIGPASAARLSEEGLTVAGEPYRPTGPSPAPAPR